MMASFLHLHVVSLPSPVGPGQLDELQWLSL